MTKYLVAYYSWTGATAKIAKAIGARLEADLEEIRDAAPRAGPFAFVLAAMGAARRKPARIAPSAKDPGAYDIVILGAPVWAQNMASPMRAYIEREKNKFKAIAVFCTLGGAGGEKVLADMARLSGSLALGALQVNAQALQSDAWQNAVDDFARQIRNKAAAA